MDPYTHFSKIPKRFRAMNLDQILVADAKRWDKNTLRAVLEQVMLSLKAEAPFRKASKQSVFYDTVVCSILDTIFVAGTELFIARGNVPSGTYVTTALNILTQLWLLCLVTVTLTETHKIRKSPIKIMQEDLLPIYMGDDLFIGCSSWFIQNFSAEEIQSIYASCNVTLTNPNKTANTIAYAPLSEMEFCSRTLKEFKVNNKELTVFPLKDISVRADSHFSTHGDKDTAISICRTKVVEACLHGKDYYDKECEAVHAILDFVGEPGIVHTPDWAEQITNVAYRGTHPWMAQGGLTPLNNHRDLQLS